MLSSVPSILPVYANGRGILLLEGAGFFRGDGVVERIS